LSYFNAAMGKRVLRTVMPAPRLVRPTPDPLPDRSDDELMTLAQAGVRDAFAVLVERHAERLAQACSRFVNDPDAGAELAQETWVAVWAARSQYRADGKFIVWLLTSARNRCRNHLRHQGVGRNHALRVAARGTEPPSPNQIDRLLVEERRRRVRDALSQLPGRMREALLLRYSEDLRYDEMAAVLRVSESTLRSRVHHGLRQLRNLLEKNQ
jgi:RNA polymerase sigma factor (sigma-70 family)